MKVAVIGAGVAGLGAAWLLSRQHDVVIYERESRFGGHACTVDAPGLAYAPLFHETLVATLPAGSVHARGKAPLRLAGLEQEAFILFPRQVGTSLYDAIVGACRSVGFAPRIEQEAMQMQTIVSLVAAGMGVALVPASLQHMRRTGVAYRPLAEREARVDIGIAWRAGDDAPVVDAFLELARSAAKLSSRG